MYTVHNQHPVWSVWFWSLCLARGDTTLSYHDWVTTRLDEAELEAV